MRHTIHANVSGGRYYVLSSLAVHVDHVVRANNQGQAFLAVGITPDRQRAWLCRQFATARAAHQSLERGAAVAS